MKYKFQYLLEFDITLKNNSYKLIPKLNLCE